MTALEYWQTLDEASQWRVALYARAERTFVCDSAPLLIAAQAIDAPIRWQDAAILGEQIARYHVTAIGDVR